MEKLLSGLDFNQLQELLTAANIDANDTQGNGFEDKTNKDDVSQESLALLEYARRTGIAINHLEEPLPLKDIEDLQITVLHIPTDDDHLPQLDFSDHTLLAECITPDKDATLLLASTNKTGTSTKEIDDIISSLKDTRMPRKIRLELPLLRTDHDADCRSFTKREAAHIDQIDLPMEPLDDEKDEGMEWSRRTRAIPDALMKEVNEEKMVINMQSFADLHTYLKDDWTNEDQKELWATILPYKKTKILEPVTPPLTPCHEIPEPYVPSSPTAQLTLLSDPPSLTSEDLRVVETAMFKNETITSQIGNRQKEISESSTRKEIELGREDNGRFSPSHYMQQRPSPPPRQRPPTENSKVEVPLMLGLALEPKKTVTFRTEVEEMLLDSHWSETICGSNLALLDGREAEEDMFKEVFDLEAAESILRKIEQEQLQEVDATKRVPIPEFQPFHPRPPWEQLRALQASPALQAAQRKSVLDYLSSHGPLDKAEISHLQQDSLKWMPFPVIHIEENFDETIGSDEDLLAHLEMVFGDNIMSSGDTTWKRDGLRVVDPDENEEDDLEEGQFLSIPHLPAEAATMNKRKVYKAEEGPKAHNPPAMNYHSSTEGLKPHKSLQQAIDRHVEKKSKAPNDFVSASSLIQREETELSHLLPSGGFAIGKALDNFMELRGTKKQKLTGSSYFSKADLSAVAVNSQASTKGKTPPTIISVPATKTFSPPIPELTMSSIPVPIIVSKTILNNQAIMKHLTHLCPSATIIERDFTTHNSLIWDRNSITSSPKISPLATEADIIPSPATGIIITTLQKVKQKPLPGQKKMSEIRTRVDGVASRYEKLIVLISSGENDRGFVLDESDYSALAAFIAFCSSLPTSTEAIYTHLSLSSQSFTGYLISIMLKEAPQSPPEELIQDETQWEVLLRRAGMNAFAAQVVLGMLKAPEGVERDSASKATMFGITAFVEMEARERRERFGAVLGGSRVLDRIDEVFQGGWME